MKEKDLKPCPCCRSRSVALVTMYAELLNGTYHEGPWAQCRKCGIQGPVKAWQNRKVRK
jgi:hypothetical protein